MNGQLIAFSAVLHHKGSEHLLYHDKCPGGLKDALKSHAPLFPSQPTLTLPESSLKGQAYTCAHNHDHVAQSQLPCVRGQKGPYLNSEWVSRVFNIPQHCRDNHNC